MFITFFLGDQVRIKMVSSFLPILCFFFAQIPELVEKNVECQQLNKSIPVVLADIYPELENLVFLTLCYTAKQCVEQWSTNDALNYSYAILVIVWVLPLICIICLCARIHSLVLIRATLLRLRSELPSTYAPVLDYPILFQRVRGIVKFSVSKSDQKQKNYIRKCYACDC